jgi:glycosyltransferase involved in cell wall biosynthesis
MKILIDLTSIFNRKLTGIEMFGLDLYFTLMDKFSNYSIYKIVRWQDDIDNKNNHLILKTKSRILSEQLLLPLNQRKIDPDLTIFPAFPPGPLAYYLKPHKTKVAVVIHDTVPWKYSDTLSLKATIYLKPLFDLAVKKADFILTVSKTVKEELEELFKLNNIFYIGEKISETYTRNNIDKCSTDILEKLNLKADDYLLSVSTLEPRKNFKYLLKVYGKLIKLGFNKKLVLVGRQGWDKDTFKIINKYDLKDKIIYTGYVTDKDLITLYKNSYSFVLLSVYEGFGRTPLEALACGTKIIVSDIPAFRESLGKYENKNTMFVPLENEDLAAEIIYTSIEKLHKNKDIDVYTELSKNFEGNISHFLDQIKKG